MPFEGFSHLLFGISTHGAVEITDFLEGKDKSLLVGSLLLENFIWEKEQVQDFLQLIHSIVLRRDCSDKLGGSKQTTKNAQ